MLCLGWDWTLGSILSPPRTTAGEPNRAAQVDILKDVVLDVRDRPVLIVEDILDSGHTLKLVRDRMAARGPAWLKTCVLLDKPMCREMEIEADYVGFDVPDVWVVGYGLDAGGEGRGLPFVAVMDQGEGKKR